MERRKKSGGGSMRYQFNRRAVINRRAILGLALGATLAGVAVAPVRADDTIKVGILHSLSGTMAISETTLKD
jgi:urea transport system substrate-binding protein